MTTSLISGTVFTNIVEEDSPSKVTGGGQQGAVVSAEEPKKWELPAHHSYSLNDRRPTQEFLDAELQIGRASICLAFVLFGTELGTGHSIPEIILTSLTSN